MSFFESRAEKKKKQLKKNKYQQMLYELVRLRRQDAERVKADDERMRPKTRPSEAKEEKDVVWSAKVGEVRNRLTDRKRASTERWNRFAGTSDAGGRGL